MPSLQDNKSHNLKLPRVILLVVLDILVCNATAFLALFIRYEFNLADCQTGGYMDAYFQWMIPNTIAVLALFAAFKLYMTLWSLSLIHI